ncbi:MAG: methyltransferase domain-containing protein [Bryobacteraceae bacterium]
MTISMEQIAARRPRVGVTDIFHRNVSRRGVLGKLYVLLFGTPHLGTFANGIYLRRAIRRMTPSSVLDAGCGDGTLAFYMASRFPKARVLGVDIGEQGMHTSESTLDICARVNRSMALGNLEFRQLDLRQLDAREEFDFAYSFDVLEHIAENRLVLQNIYRALMPGGLLLLRIPTRNQRRILSRRFTSEHERWAQIEHVGQHYEMDSLQADLKQIGYEVLSAEYTMGNWGRLSFELSEALQYYHVPQALQMVAMPVLKMLRFFDTRCAIRGGDGLLVLCRKSRRAA